MKGLNQFVDFDWDKFANGKVFIVTNVSEYSDYETKKHLGTKVEAVIAADRTPYSYKDGKVFNNLYEKVTFKVTKDVNVPLEASVQPKGVTATIYGDYRNLLSIKCQDIAVVGIPTKEKN